MGIGHQKSKQLQLFNSPWKFRYNHGGVLRNKRRGRKARPLSTKAPLHLVFKTERKHLQRGLRSPLGFYIIQKVIKKFAAHFFVKIEQLSINHDHIHMLVRFTKRTQGLHFLRVVAGQIAQEFQKARFLKVTDTPNTLKLWKYRPFTRVIKGYKPYQIVKNYIQLNEKEASGKIKYKTQRLRGLSLSESEILWC